MSKVKLKNNDRYTHKKTGEVWTLREDYNGLWFISLRDEEGYKKSLSTKANEMIELIERSFQVND